MGDTPPSDGRVRADRYSTHYRLYCYRGPDSTVEQHDWFEWDDLDGRLRSAERVAGDDALWSFATVLTDPGSAVEQLVWLVGTDYTRPPINAVERYRNRDMEQRFLMKRSEVEQPPRLPDGRRVVRMFAETGVRYPLWESFTGHYPARPEHFGLSEDLGEALRRWKATEEAAGYAQVWGPADVDTWMLEGDQLADWIEVEAGHDVRVRREYRMHWPPEDLNWPPRNADGDEERSTGGE